VRETICGLCTDPAGQWREDFVHNTGFAQKISVAPLGLIESGRKYDHGLRPAQLHRRVDQRYPPIDQLRGGAKPPLPPSERPTREARRVRVYVTNWFGHSW
jgi:hypothetical protein